MTTDPCRLTLLTVHGQFAVCKLPIDSPLPAWVTAGDLFCVARTPDELSVVCRPELVPGGVRCEPGWRALRVAGAMPFDVVGVMAAITRPLADAGVSLFAFSTFDTDYMLVQAANLPAAVAALHAAGHHVEGAGVPS